MSSNSEPKIYDVHPEEIHQFPSGATRSSDADMEAYYLITPDILSSLARTYAEGAKKYGDFNWEKGMPASDLLNHAIRHYTLFISGDTREDHLGHMLWNIGAAIHSLAHWPQLNQTFLAQLTKRRRELVDSDKCLD
jgi:hypothetical protein